ncbi:MAG: fumarylacetoacetate hydrolase family protein [Bacteroidia bacterium]|nr:fumarylacetoacetate hydrolase family protein [Bacteroidia bacterium]
MKIICVGRNYAAHAQELANAIPDKPLIFLKPETAILEDNRDFLHPNFSNDIHWECELVYRVAKDGSHVSQSEAWDYIDGIGLGIDFTARDLQDEIKKKGHPWTLAKMFDHSAPISKFLDPKSYADHKNLHFELRVNDVVRQSGFSGNMIFPLDVLIAYITQFITLKAGDLIFTGTPEGVGKVNVGDRLQASLEGKELLDFYVK